MIQLRLKNPPVSPSPPSPGRGQGTGISGTLHGGFEWRLDLFGHKILPAWTRSQRGFEVVELWAAL